MLKKLTALVVLAFASLLLPAAGASAQVATDNYGPDVPTQTHITIVVGQVGEPIVVDFKVTANDPQKPTGDLSIQIGARGSIAQAAAPTTYSKVVRVSGKQVQVTGPKLSPGRYTVAASYTPDANSVFLPSSNVKDITVARGGGDAPGNDDSGLPNTGGPDLWLLMAGLVLVGGGAGAAVYSRRRQHGAKAAV